MSDTSTTVRGFFDGMNSHDLEAVASLTADDYEFVDVATGEHVHGPDAWREYCGRYLTAFPDLRLELTKLVVAGDEAFAEAVAHGTNDGPLATPAGELPASGQTVGVPFSMVFRVSDGKVVEGREYYDAMTLMTQLGLMPQPA